MLGIRQNPFSAILLSVLSLSVLLFAADQVFRYARFADLQYWARQIEKGRPVEYRTLDRLLSETNGLNIESECQSAFVKSQLTILLADMDRHNPTSDYDNWFKSLQRTETLLGHALSCLPTDGNLWVRYAMIRQASAEQPAELAELLGLSQHYSPAEENAISARYQLYTRLTDASLTSAAGPLGDDLKVLCSPVAENLRNRLPAPNARLEQTIKKIAPSCPPIGKILDEHRFDRNKPMQTVF